jgi:hypothetical protein
MHRNEYFIMKHIILPEYISWLSSLVNVSVEYLLGHQNGKQRKGGPVRKARRIFEKVSRRPESWTPIFLNIILAQSVPSPLNTAVSMKKGRTQSCPPKPNGRRRKVHPYYQLLTINY